MHLFVLLQDEDFFCGCSNGNYLMYSSFRLSNLLHWGFDICWIVFFYKYYCCLLPGINMQYSSSVWASTEKGLWFEESKFVVTTNPFRMRSVISSRYLTSLRILQNLHLLPRRSLGAAFLQKMTNLNQRYIKELGSISARRIDWFSKKHESAACGKCKKNISTDSEKGVKCESYPISIQLESVNIIATAVFRTAFTQRFLHLFLCVLSNADWFVQRSLLFLIRICCEFNYGPIW